MSDPLTELADFIERHPRLLVLTGAGMSTASGIPDYRDRDGNRRGRTPVQGPDFRKFDAVRRHYWARSMVGYPALARAAPNNGHLALAALEAQGRIRGLMTQNVDGLHQRAGSAHVLELHGNIHQVLCLDCHAGFARSFVQQQLEADNPGLLAMTAHIAPDGDAHVETEALQDFQIPWCVHCSGMLKPDVVFFGDGVPAERSADAFARMHGADALLVVGSSLMVFSGFRFCRMAAASGKPVAAVNIGKTRADDLLSLKIEDAAEAVLPGVLARLG